MSLVQALNFSPESLFYKLDFIRRDIAKTRTTTVGIARLAAKHEQLLRCQCLVHGLPDGTRFRSIKNYVFAILRFHLEKKNQLNTF